MSILITGGAGFIGSHLIPHLLATTDQRLVVLDDFNDFYDPALKRRNAAAWKAKPRVTLVEGDAGDRDTADRVLLDHQVTVIFHLAASPGVPASLRQPAACFQNNVTATVTLLEAARRRPIERFLFASSSTVYGRGAQAPFVEDAPLGTPASPYGASKRSAELAALTYQQLFDTPCVCLRFFNVYGPRLRPELALAVFTRAIVEGTPLPVFGDGLALRDFTHVSDVCRGLVTAMQAPAAIGQCINLGHDQPISIRHLIELVESATGRKARIEHCPPRAEDMQLTHADLSKSRELLAYEPTVGIEEGVREYVQWYQTTGRT